MKFSKGKCVKFTRHNGLNPNLTIDKVYEIVMESRDVDIEFGGYVGENSFMIRDNNQELIYCRTKNCAFGDWELVEEPSLTHQEYNMKRDLLSDRLREAKATVQALQDELEYIKKRCVTFKGD